MDLPRIRKTSDQFGRYYTDQSVASVLVSAIDECYVKSVIDLGAGDGALLSEAKKRWDQAQLIAVDIDKGANIFDAKSLLGNGVKTCVADALCEDIDTKLGLKFGSVDLALCNPPYIKAKWRKHFSEIMEDAGLSGVISKIDSTPSELLFVAQNIRFLKSAGVLALILPDGLISGEKFCDFRRALIQEHCLSRVIELPRRIFKKTDAKAHIVVIKKNCGPSEGVLVQSLQREGAISDSIYVPADKGIRRLDYTYHSSGVGLDRSPLALRDVSLGVRRGRVSSVELFNFDWPVFHITDLSEHMKFVPKKFIVKDGIDLPRNLVTADHGDILISRVGRNLERKVVIVDGGRVPISDCILSLKVKEGFRKQVFELLKSGQGRLALHAISHGVGARFITVDSLLDITIP